MKRLFFSLALIAMYSVNASAIVHSYWNGPYQGSSLSGSTLTIACGGDPCKLCCVVTIENYKEVPEQGDPTTITSYESSGQQCQTQPNHEWTGGWSGNSQTWWNQLQTEFNVSTPLTNIQQQY